MNHRIRGLGLSLLAALGLMSFVAAGAQAVTWDVGGSEIKTDLLIDGKLKETGVLLVPAAGVNLEVRCTTLDVELDSRLLAVPNDALVFLLFLNCTAFRHTDGAALPNCVPTVDLVNALVKPFLHNNVVKLLATPHTGTTFTKVKFNEETCALPPSNNVTGSVVFECENGSLVLRSCAFAAVNQLIRPVSHATQLSLYPTDVLKFGLNVALLLKGEAEIFMHEKSGAAGKTLAALI